MGLLRRLVCLFQLFVSCLTPIPGMQTNECEQLPPHILQEVKNNGEDEKLYLDKIQHLRQYLDFLRTQQAACTDSKIQSNIHYAIEAILLQK